MNCRLGLYDHIVYLMLQSYSNINYRLTSLAIPLIFNSKYSTVLYTRNIVDASKVRTEQYV